MATWTVWWLPSTEPHACPSPCLTPLINDERAELRVIDPLGFRIAGADRHEQLFVCSGADLAIVLRDREGRGTPCSHPHRDRADTW